jgi:Ricin-type beta-trefoil lectin domain
VQGRGGRRFFRGAVGGLLLAGLSGAPVVPSAGAASAAPSQTSAAQIRITRSEPVLARAARAGNARRETAQSTAAQSPAAQIGSAQIGSAQIGPAQIGPAQIGPAQIGPAQINAMGRPDLCWQAAGNGALVTLARCASALQSQQWALTSNGVLMNGTGYCLEAAPGGLFIDFADQCGGSPAQQWQFSAVRGTLTSAATGRCAVASGVLTPGTAVVGGTCTAAAADRRWSLGYSAVTVSAGTAHGPAGGTFTAAVTVTNAASAQAAYGATIHLGRPRGLAARALRGTGGAAGWRCDVPALTCSGNLAAGAAGRIEIAGRLPAAARPGTSYRLLAAVSVAGTSQQAGTAPTMASVPVTVLGAPPGPGGTAASPATGVAGQGGTASGTASNGVLAGGLVAGILLLGGGLLVAVTRRRPPGGPDARDGDRETAAPPSDRARATRK